MLVCVSCMVSMDFIVMGLIQETIKPWGYSDDNASTFGFWMNICGVPAGFIAAGIITKTGKFRITSAALVFFTIIGTIMF